MTARGATNDRAGLLNQLDQRVLIGDGAMGTELYRRGVPLTANFDELNLSRPETVRSVHADYVTAGSQLIESNTYGANRGRLQGYGLSSKIVDINSAGVQLAREAAGKNAYVAGSIGSLPTGDSADDTATWTPEELYDIFREQAVILADAGADAILLETFSDLEQLQIGVQATRDHVDLPIIAQLTFQHRAVTASGVNVFAALESLVERGADIVGTNCGRGVANVLHIVEEFTSQSQARMSAFPNAGFPEDVGGRIMYLSSPQYLAKMIERMVDAGANLVGGCCGTSPQSIESIAERIGRRRPIKRTLRAVPTAIVEPPPALPPARTTYLDRVRDRPLIFVELDPPFGLDFDRLMTGCRVLHNMGVDAITMGDAPLATLRVNNIAAASLIQNEVGIECIIHMTCRDHNIIGLQSMLMGAWVEGIKSVLVITGDPAKLGNQPGASSVYDLNSIGLIKIARTLNEGHNYAGASIKKATGFNIGCGFNPNFKNLQFEVGKLKKKIDAGAMFIMTQLTFDPGRYAEAVHMIRDAGITAPIFPAIFPFLSGRNAEFLHNELPGVRVPEKILERMGKTDKTTGPTEGMRIAKELVEEFWQHADGLYIVPPFNRYEMAAELVEHVQSHSGALSRGSGI